MATIPNQGGELRHVRKTVAFTGAANLGALGDSVPVFTVTGHVLLERQTTYCSENLACSAPASTGIALYTNGGAGDQMSATVHADGVVGDWMYSSGTPGWFAGTGDGVPQSGVGYIATSGNIVATILELDAGLGANVTDGTIVVDVWYRPITDDGAIAGDDIDQDVPTSIWAKAMSDIAAVPAITASALSALNWLFALARNKLTETSSTQTLKKDDGTTTIGTASVSDDGTTFTRDEWS